MHRWLAVHLDFSIRSRNLWYLVWSTGNVMDGGEMVQSNQRLDKRTGVDERGKIASRPSTTATTATQATGAGTTATPSVPSIRAAATGRGTTAKQSGRSISAAAREGATTGTTEIRSWTT